MYVSESLNIRASHPYLLSSFDRVCLRNSQISRSYKMRALHNFHHAILFLWRCLCVCLVLGISSGAFVLSTSRFGKRIWDCNVTPIAPTCGGSRIYFSSPKQLALNTKTNMVDSSSGKEDDDDISQHTVSVDDNGNNNKANSTTTTTTTTTTATGYRPIESWHRENRNPNHVLDQLKREQAHWKGRFEDLGGDGI